MTQKERVRIVRDAGFAGYDKSLDSKCAKPEKYGICRVEVAQAAVEAVATTKKGVFAYAKGKRSADRHKPCARISHRLSLERREQIRLAVEVCGYGTVQNWLETCVYRLLTEAGKRKAPAGAGTSDKGSMRNHTITTISPDGGKVK